MKALTIKQPWATLIMRHGKDVENRTWPTKFRGRIAIHSSAKHSWAEFESAKSMIQNHCFGIDPDYLKGKVSHLGAILGTVEIYDCVTSSPSPWSWGPYSFLLRDVRVLKSPIFCRGKLGLWTIDQAIERVINEEIGDKQPGLQSKKARTA
jgi:hypothetical protein